MVMMEAMPMVEGVVKNISAKEVRERRRIANPRVGLAEAASASWLQTLFGFRLSLLQQLSIVMQ